VVPVLKLVNIWPFSTKKAGNPTLGKFIPLYGSSYKIYRKGGVKDEFKRGSER
jgi:hypothetical protein